MKTFEQELTEIINRHSMENASNTPDFILAEYLRECLECFNNTMSKRDQYYNIEHRYSDTKDIVLVKG